MTGFHANAVAPPRSSLFLAGPGSPATPLWGGAQGLGTLGPRSLTEVSLGS